MFVPTYLYIKKHNTTGKLYFGKTTSDDPTKYKGSGKHWKNHIKKYGEEFVETIWYKLFDSEEDIIEFAHFFSEEFNIVNSDKWLNLVPENGINGGSVKGRRFKQSKPSPLIGKKRKPFTEEHLKNMSTSHIGKNLGDSNPSKREDVRDKISKSLKGIPKSEEHKRKLSEYKGTLHHAYGKPLSEEAKKKLSISKRGKPTKKVECPHCNKIGGITNMKRYHFDNCKFKGEYNER